MQQFTYAGRGQKLVQFLLQNIPLASFSKIQKLLRTKDILVNGVRVSNNVNLNDGDQIIVHGIKPATINIIYQDDNIVIVDKPSGIEVVSEDNTSLQQVVTSQLAQPIYAVHRLDRNTSGLCMFAKNDRAKKQLESNIKGHKIIKGYWAVVEGVPKQKSGQLNVYLKKDAANSFVQTSDVKLPGYDLAVTKYNLVKTDQIVSLLNVTLITGKTHQIRASFAHIGNPILGDQKYGDKNLNKQYKASRQYLMACYLKLDGFVGQLAYLNGKQFSLDNTRLIEELNIK